MTYDRAKADASAYKVIRRIVKGRGRVRGVFYIALKDKTKGPAGVIFNTFAKDPAGRKTLQRGKEMRGDLSTRHVARGVIGITPDGILDFTVEHATVNTKILKKTLWRTQTADEHRGTPTHKLGRLIKKARFTVPTDDIPLEDGVDDDFVDDDVVSPLDREDLEEMGLDEVEIDELMQLERSLVDEFATLEKLLQRDDDDEALQLAQEAEEHEREVRATANDLRYFCRELLLLSGQEHTPEQADALREVLASQQPPRILAYLAGGGDMKELMRKAELPRLPPSMSDTLEQLAALQTPDPLLGLGTARLMEMPPEQRLTLLKAVDDAYFFDLVDQVDAGLEEAKFSESDEIKLLIDPETGFDMSRVPPAFAAFFRRVLTEYFDILPIEAKRQIMADILGEELGASTPTKLAAVLNGAGPAVQKLFQLAGEEVESPELDEVMAGLKHHIRPFPNEQARKTIERAYGQPIEEIFDDFGPDPIAAATIGQVYLARLKDGHDVVVKVIRPGVKERAKQELEQLKGLAPEPGLRQIVERLEESLMEEVDFLLEAKNIETAQEVYYKPKSGIYPVTLASPDLPATPEVLVMDRAAGTTMDKVAEEHLKLKGEALATLMRDWFDEAIFKSGFFHGDLHAGNLFLNPERAYKIVRRTNDDGEVEIVHAKQAYAPKYQCTLIDFGNAAQLDDHQREALLQLIFKATFPQPVPLVDAMMEVMKMDEKQHAALVEFVTARMEQKELGGELLLATINKAIELQVDIPKEIILFHRGRTFLDRQMVHLNQQLDEIDPRKRIKRYDPLEVLVKLVRKRAWWKGTKAWLDAHGL